MMLPIYANLDRPDTKLLEASGDLYDSPFTTFWKVTFPLLLAGIVAASLLSFAMSFGDFITTNFNSGNFSTFPTFIYVSATRDIPAQANVIGSAMFVPALVVVETSRVVAYRGRKALAARQDRDGHAICATNHW